MVKKINNTKDEYKYFIKLGILNAKNKNFIEAKKNFRKAMELNNEYPDSYINLSNLYAAENEKKLALDLLYQFFVKFKLDLKIVENLFKLSLYFNYYKYVEKLIKILNIRKLDIASKHHFIFFVYAKYLEHKNNFSESIKMYEKSINCYKHFNQAYFSILQLLESTNNIKKFKKYLNEGQLNFKSNEEKLKFKYYESLLLNRLKKFKESNQIIVEHNLKKNLYNNTEIYLKILDIQAKNEEGLENYKLAFELITNRNKYILNLEKNNKYNRDTLIETLSKYKSFFIKKNINKINKNNDYYDDKNLAFLVGFPRSGTTLLDTILRSHSKINVLEEKPILLNLRHKYFEDRNNSLNSLLRISNYEKNQIRNEYFKLIEKKLSKNKKVIIDKLPLSLIEIGFIKTIFPNSKIILVLRHPCDVVLSCYFSYFEINDAMINFLDWDDTIDFYNRVFDFFEFYQKETNLISFHIKYENLVTNFFSEVSSLLNFLGLDYENKIDNFHITALKREKISTPSYKQVINPIYTSSIGKWKKYIETRNPERKLEKWIKKFNY
tara:strand:+ start:13424 stop:15076 length:1653 start_codon:yes stop_codon:yes gene_type:complete